MRQNSTNAERILWKHLRAKQLGGYKFRRQEPIENFIVDFICYETKLIIELDGGQHANEELKDQLRSMKLKSLGFAVKRFWNTDVYQNLDGILESILSYCDSYSTY